jgi:CRP-like cAMP-binding protein
MDIATEASTARLSSYRPIGNRLLAEMPPDGFALLEPDLRQVTLPQGTVCFEPGEPIDQVYFPHNGMISMLVVSREGAMVEISSIGCEGAAGLQCGLGPRLSFTRAAVQITGNFHVIPAARFEQAAARSETLRDIIFRYNETVLAEAVQTAACNAIHDGSSRLCRWLLQCADRIGSAQLALTQELLADMLGVRRTTVTLLAQDLQRRGVLRYSRGKITILDRAALETCACECYEATKHHNLAHRIGVKL